MVIWELVILFFLLLLVAKISHNKMKNFNFKSSGMGAGMARVNADPTPNSILLSFQEMPHKPTQR